MQRDFSLCVSLERPPDRPAFGDLSERVLVAEYAGLFAQKGMEFFGCEQGKGVLLPTDEGDGSFLVAGGARVSLYLPPQEQGAENRPPRRRDGRWWAIAGV